MLVYKFGGASVKDGWGIRNLTKIAGAESDNLVVVVSAFGKTTNALESILRLWLNSDCEYQKMLDLLASYHRSILNDLGMEGSRTSMAFEDSLNHLSRYLRQPTRGGYDLEYDQVVSYGELWSTIIVSGYLNVAGVMNRWLDIRKVFITDTRYRDANILWKESHSNALAEFSFSDTHMYVTQGFIGGTGAGNTTTLGREGSDYTAAVLANMLDARYVVVWKDVPGLLNADPKWMPDAVRLPAVSYKEAVEMTFSGAKVIHPKTIKPLHNKSIPLYVKSFIEPETEGTVILSDAGGVPSIPVFVRKEEQIMISILPRDFSFAIGENLSRIFVLLSEAGIAVNLVQASAVSINICADYEKDKVQQFITEIGDDFKVGYNEGVEMITIRHYTDEAMELMTSGRQVMIEQRTRRTVRFVLRQNDSL